MNKTKVMQLGVAFASLFLMMVGILSIKAASGAAPMSIPGQQAAQSGQSAQPGSDQPALPGKPLVWGAVHSDTSPPLSSIPPKITRSQPQADNENPDLPLRGKLGAADNVIQRITGPLTMPTPSTSFEGIPNVFGPLPADTNGDVGRTQYVQIVNSGFEVWTKTGTPIYGPANNNTIFTGFGGVCETHNDGDVIALYDALADRWVLTWFTSSAPYMECIAVSVTPDATGAYYRYAFPDHNSGNTLGDYPHMAVWPDAYYMTTNENGGPSGNYAYDRSKMLRGDPTAQLVYFHSSVGGMLPSDLDSANNLPPAGSPNYFIEFNQGSPGQLAEFKFHVDFVTPANSTFTGPFIISVADFNPNAPGVPEPGTTTLLDSLSDRLMYRLAYRNFGSYESLVLNHTVNAGGVAGIRWYELRDPNNGAGASVFQQGTYAPGDGLHRWMGSIAQDRMGDMILGFSIGNATHFPSINYAGRLVSDPLGQLSQGEGTLLAGTGSEDYPGVGRWGDYSAMQIDPVDDCTFWYTTMYFAVTGERDWRTHIGSFKFPGCTAQGTPTPVASPTAPAPTNTPVLPTPTQCPNSINATGSITNTDSIQTGRLSLFDPKSSCDTAKSVSPISENLTRHYDSYTYTNTSGSTQCVTVSITQACSNNAVQSVTYHGSFNPNSIQTNYLADGGSGGQHYSYSFSLPAGQTAVVVVVEVSPNLGCETYDISINPCSVGSTTVTPTSPPTSTPTSVPPSSTPTTAPPSSTPTSPPITPTGPPPITPSNTPTTVPPSNTPGVPTATPTACTLRFSDVPVGSTFYPFIRCLACKGIINGYPDGTFRPGNNVTRGQLSKIVSNSAGFNDTPTGQQYEDVPVGSTFYVYIYRLVHRGFINGYPCGAPPAGACVPPGNLPYFLPNANSTRGQISKIVSNARGFNETPSGQQFQDVGPNSPFYTYIYRLVLHQVMSGYPCGISPAGQCVPPGNLPYFLPNNNATRGQTSKIVSNTFFPDCNPPEGVTGK
jgi:hypothetical protein